MMPLSPQQGKTYEFALLDGTALTLRFDGLGKWMAPIWFEPATGATVSPLPPYVSYKQID